MTCVIAWLPPKKTADHCLWIAADSLITGQDFNGDPKPRLDIIPKISAIPIKIRFGDILPFREIFSIGFAFSGNTLVATAMRDTLAYQLGSLQKLGHTTSDGLDLVKELDHWNSKLHPFNLDITSSLPSLLKIATFAIDIFKEIYRSIIKNTMEAKEGCKILIYGYCFKNMQYECYELSHSPNSDNIISNKRNISDDDDVFRPVIIGDRIDDVSSAISLKRSSLTGLDRERAPLFALSEIIEDPTFPTIGGHIQIARCTPCFGVTVMGTLQMVAGEFVTRYYGYNPHGARLQGVPVLRTLGQYRVNPPTFMHPKDS